MSLSPAPFRMLLQLDLTRESSPAGGWSAGGYEVVMLLLILLVMALAAAFLYVKRFGVIRQGGKGKLEILETRPLGGRQFLVVGKYGRESFLLGVCPGRIDYLTRLGDGDPGSGFAEALDTARGPGREPLP
ncbi:MAG: flagellar biosynthetic protein FliO [Oceanipulchritudo sp.]